MYQTFPQFLIRYCDIELSNTNGFLNIGPSNFDFSLQFTYTSRCRKNKKKTFLNVGPSNFDFDLLSTDTTRCRQTKLKKQWLFKRWTLQCWLRVAFYRYNSMSFKTAWTSLRKTILFESRRSLSQTLRPFGPLVFAWVSQGCLQEPFWPPKADFTQGQHQLLRTPLLFLT